MFNLVNKWHLWLAKTQVSRVKWLERNMTKMYYLALICLFAWVVVIAHKLA